MKLTIVLVAVLSVLLVVIVWLAPSLLQPEVTTHIVDDFSQYWAAGRLNLSGLNPYSPVDVYELQLTIQPQKGRPTMMWNPPWTLAATMPFGMMPYVSARLLWLATQLAIIVGCIVGLWRFYGDESPNGLVVAALVVGFPPSLNALGEGQITGLILLGLVGFLYFQRVGHELLAGACAALTLIKPHLVLLFWCALVMRALQRKQIMALLGASLTIATMTSIAVATNPPVFQQYWDALLNSPPYHWVPPTIGALLRMVFGWDHTYLTFVAPALGVFWVTYYCHRHRVGWRWDEHMPLVILVCVTTTAYGWVFDQIVLLIPIVVAAQWAFKQRGPRVSFVVVAYLATCVFGLYVSVYQTTLVADFTAGAKTDEVRAMALGFPNSFWFIVTPPVLLVAYLVFRGKDSQSGVGLEVSETLDRRSDPTRG